MPWANALTTELHLERSYHRATSRTLLPQSYISNALTTELHLERSYHRATSWTLLPQSYISNALTTELHLERSYHRATSRTLLPQSYISNALTIELHLERSYHRATSRSLYDHRVYRCLYVAIGACLAAENLKIVPVRSYKDIESKIEEGTLNRTVASTNMNATSRYCSSLISKQTRLRNNAI